MLSEKAALHASAMKTFLEHFPDQRFTVLPTALHARIKAIRNTKVPVIKEHFDEVWLSTVWDGLYLLASDFAKDLVKMSCAPDDPCHSNTSGFSHCGFHRQPTSLEIRTSWIHRMLPNGVNGLAA